MVAAVEAAAPRMPKRGMAHTFSARFNKAATQMMRWATRSWPVMFSKYITGPHRAFTSCPKAKQSTHTAPDLKAGPNHAIHHAGATARAKKAGTLKATLRPVVWANAWRNPASSPTAWRSANQGAA